MRAFFLLNEMTSRGVRVVSAIDPTFDTATTHGTFLLRMLSAVADIEHTGALEDRRVHRLQKQRSVHERPSAGQP